VYVPDRMMLHEVTQHITQKPPATTHVYVWFEQQLDYKA